MVDRACIGHCWSPGNYEASSGQFRIRIAGQTRIVAPTEGDATRLEDGTYVVEPGDLPLAQIQVDDYGRLIVRQPQPGKPIGITHWNGM
jgi:hypothetical protein